MIIDNLHFFDRVGRNLNLDFNTTTNIWEGRIFFEGISIFLFDNENLFILEEVAFGWIILLDDLLCLFFDFFKVGLRNC